MKISIIADKLRMEKREFITSEDLKEYCKVLHLSYDSSIHYLLKMKHLVRIFRGVFYVKTLEEFRFDTIKKYNHLELVAKGLELKKIKNWYFGLHTALKLNGMTHEYFSIDEVISDSLFRAKPIGIVGYKFRCVKLASTLVNFGIKRDRMYCYSDPEKTILDFIYLLTYRGVARERIIMDVSEWTEHISKNKIKTYSSNYPKTTASVALEIATR